MDTLCCWDDRAGVGSGCSPFESFIPMVPGAHSHLEKPKWASRLDFSLKCQVTNRAQPPQNANLAEARSM